MLWRIRGAAALMLLLTASCGSSTSAGPLDETPRETPTASSPSATTRSDPRRPSDDIVLTIGDPRVQESSGLARSPQHAGVLYTHNDRGDTQDLYAVDKFGTRAVLRLTGPTGVDWEAMASTPDGRLWVADIGDADNVRTSTSVSVVEEPAALTSVDLPTTTYHFRYADGPRNAEALLVDPGTHRIYIVSKEPGGGKVYAAPEKLVAGKIHVLRPFAEAPPNVTAGDFSPDGRALALRSYSYAYFYNRFGDRPLRVATPEQEQGESIAFDKTGSHVLLGSEGRNSKILRMAVPKAVLD